MNQNEHSLAETQLKTKIKLEETNNKSTMSSLNQSSNVLTTNDYYINGGTKSSLNPSISFSHSTANVSSSSSINITDKNDVNLVKAFAYAACREYLGGAWNNVDFSDFKIERIRQVLFRLDILNHLIIIKL